MSGEEQCGQPHRDEKQPHSCQSLDVISPGQDTVEGKVQRLREQTKRNIWRAASAIFKEAHLSPVFTIKSS